MEEERAKGKDGWTGGVRGRNGLEDSHARRGLDHGQVDDGWRVIVLVVVVVPLTCSAF